MIIHKFIDYRFNQPVDGLLPVDVWMHNWVDGVDIFHVDESCPEFEEANWVINRLVEARVKTPSDFLEYYQQWAGYRRMRGQVREADTDLGYDEFGRQTLRAAVERESNATTD